MQPDLPWNVAGIPSEAREAARASARREGLSVGEWLTRRILGALAEPEPAEAKTWRSETRESNDMLARVSRSGAEAENAYKRIEDHLRVLSRRLDQTERSQSENGRAMSKAATEISIASREQSQAFDQLGAHVVGLSERLKRVEQQTASDSLREAVKVLHQGLSRLADQMASTANQSASQIAAVAGNVETVASKLQQARLETENAKHSLDQRVRQIEESKVLAEVSAKITELAEHLQEHESETAAAVAKLEQNLSRLEARANDSSLAHRVQAIEHAMSDASARIDHVDRRSSANAQWEEALRTLNERLEESEKRQRDSAVELQSAIKDLLARHAEPQPQASPPAPEPYVAPHFEPAPQHFEPAPLPPMPAEELAADFDLPPFPAPEPEAPAGNFSEPFNVPPPPPFETEVRADYGPQPGESYLAAARRSAREAAVTQTEGHTAFNWGFARPQREEAEPQPNIMRYALIGGIAVIAVLALAAGLILRSHQPAQVPADIGAAFEKPKATVQAKTQPAPVIKPSKTEPETPAPSVKPAAPAQPVAVKQAAVETKKAEAPKAAPPPPKPATPAEHLAALANEGNAGAEVLLGLKYLEGTGTPVNEAEAARWFERAAAQGDPIGEYRLGTLYERGRGVAADATKAARWYAAAANQGNRKAMHNLAVAYAQGSGVQKDYALAAQWFSRAANLGLADSQFNLAVLYERGLGVPQSLLDAYKWYAVAAAQGDAESRQRIDALATQIRPDDRAAAQRSADGFKPQPMKSSANTPPDISALPPA